MIKPINNYIVVKLPTDQKTKNGLYVGNIANKPNKATIVATSDQSNLTTGKTVIIDPLAIIPINLEEYPNHVLIHEKNILAILG